MAAASLDAHSADWQQLLLLGFAADDPLVLDLAEALSEESVIGLAALDAGQLALLGEACHRLLPDLIMISASAVTAQGEDVGRLCLSIREQHVEHRPVLVIYGASEASESDRIAWLTQGADDVLSSALSLPELKIRLLIQLRRNLEVMAHPVTQLPGLPFASKILQRRLNRDDNGAPPAWALMVVKIDHLASYEEVYGHLPLNQVLRALSAMITRTVVAPDFVAHAENHAWWIVTQPERAPKIATLLCRQFEAAVPNFYSERDRKQGYMISVPSDRASRRIPFLSLSMGIASSKTQPVASFLSAHHTAVQMLSLAEQKPGNTWVMESPQLVGEQSAGRQAQAGIVVVESDAALAFLLKTTLQMDGFAVEVFSSAQEAWQYLGNLPEEQRRGLRLLIVDSVLSPEEAQRDPAQWSGLHLCEQVKADWPGLTVICTATVHQRERILRAGADLYLPKPFEISTLFAWVHRFLGGGH